MSKEMGNHHTTPNGSPMVEMHTHKRGFVARRKQKLEELKNRRQSMPMERFMLDANRDQTRHSNFTSFNYGDPEERIRSTTPKILVNGADSSNSSTESVSPTPPRQPHRRHPPGVQSKISLDEGAEMRSVDSSAPPAEDSAAPKRHRFIRNPKSAASRRLEFLSFQTNFIVRSLDETHAACSAIEHDLDIDLKPLSHRARSLSPLKQLRTYNSQRFSSEEDVLSPEHCECIRLSWKAVVEHLAATPPHDPRHFGLLALKRFLNKRPALRLVFGLEPHTPLEELGEDSSIIRHAHLLHSIIDLSVRNVDELESEIGPVIFVYGRRHCSSRVDLQGTFNEETVRLFCGQVICTILDVLGNELTTAALEAWIELMRFIGRALLNGYEYESLQSSTDNKKKFVINTNHHAFYLA